MNQQVDLYSGLGHGDRKKKFDPKGGWSLDASWLVADGERDRLLSGYREQATIKYFDAKDGKALHPPLPHESRGVDLPEGSLHRDFV